MTFTAASLLSAVSALIGSMIFFAATVAPTVFRTLSMKNTGAFLRSFFPRYYMWGFALAAIAAVLAAAIDGYLLAACALVASLFAYARQILMPQINEARDNHVRQIAGAGTRFHSLHIRSVAINALQLLLLTLVAAYLLWMTLV